MIGGEELAVKYEGGEAVSAFSPFTID